MKKRLAQNKKQLCELSEKQVRILRKISIIKSQPIHREEKHSLCWDANHMDRKTNKGRPNDASKRLKEEILGTLDGPWLLNSEEQMCSRLEFKDVPVTQRRRLTLMFGWRRGR